LLPWLPLLWPLVARRKNRKLLLRLPLRLRSLLRLLTLLLPRPLLRLPPRLLTLLLLRPPLRLLPRLPKKRSNLSSNAKKRGFGPVFHCCSPAATNRLVTAKA
jgi:hypothetical protein